VTMIVTQSTQALWKSYDRGSLHTPLHWCPQFTSRHVHTTLLGVSGMLHWLWLYHRAVEYYEPGLVWFGWPDLTVQYVHQ